MSKFRLVKKIPVIVGAWEYTGSVQDMPEALAKVISIKVGHNELYIPSLEGEMTAQVGDWIIRGVNGEFYPCKPDIFAKTYEILE